MRTISGQTVGRINEVWFSRITGITRVLGAVLSFAMLHSPIQALSAVVPPSYSVTLRWDSSSSPEVTGYRVYYGTQSGNYTNNVAVGNVTTALVSGLASGVTYFFTVAAYNASGLESDFSNEISFMPGLPTVKLRVTPTRQFILTVAGQVGHTYEIQATQDLKNWTSIGSVTVGAVGWLDFIDANAANFTKRFYRIRDTQP